MAPLSYWHDSLAPGDDLVARRPLPGDRSADVAIIGAGFTGLWTAHSLLSADPTLRVVVLERDVAGFGASGRNGGQICTAYASGMDSIERRMGREDARRLFQLSEEAKAILCERIERFEIDCNLTRGYLLAAERAREMRECEEWAESAARDYDYAQLELIRDSQKMRELVDSPRYIGGLVDQGAGHLHPLNYCLGLARGAATLGVRQDCTGKEGIR